MCSLYFLFEPEILNHPWFYVVRIKKKNIRALTFSIFLNVVPGLIVMLYPILLTLIEDSEIS